MADIAPIGDEAPKRNATISINGGPEIPVEILKDDDGGMTAKEIRRPLSRRRLPADGIELTKECIPAPGSKEWLVRQSLGEFSDR